VRDLDHYRSLLGGADTIGPKIMADAIHVARGGHGKAPSALVRYVMRQYGDAIESQTALALLADEAGASQPDTDSIAARIKAARESIPMSHADVAELAGVSKQTVINLEQSASANPGVVTLAAVARALGVGLTDLIGD